LQQNSILSFEAVEDKQGCLRFCKSSLEDFEETIIQPKNWKFKQQSTQAVWI